MITVAAIRMEQFGVQFYQASLTARDVGKLVRFEVLSYGEKTQPLRGSTGKGTSKVNWDLLERRIAANEKSYQRQIIGKKIEELVQVLRAVPRGAQPARRFPAPSSSPRRSRCASRRSGDEWQNLGVLKVPEREGHPARHRRPAPAAGAAQRHRAVRPRRLPRAGGDLRSAAGRPRRADVRHDQRQAHPAQPVAPGVAGRAPALRRSEPGRRARRDPRPDRAGGFGAARRHQAARRRPRPRRPGAAGAGAQAAVRVGRLRRAEEVGRLPRPVGSASSSTTSSRSPRCSTRRGTAASTASRARRRCGRSSASRRTSSSASTRSTPSAPTSAPSAASSRPGAGASATCGSRPTARGSATGRGSISWPRSCAWRCSIPKARRSDSGPNGQPRAAPPRAQRGE